MVFEDIAKSISVVKRKLSLMPKAAPFSGKTPTSILGSAAFIDIGYIWKDIDIDIWNPKRSIGFGLRFSSPKLSGFQVYRLDLAFPLDRENRSKPVISYAVGQAF